MEEIIQQFLIDNSLTDVTVIGKNGSMKAHKLILATVSPILKHYFSIYEEGRYLHLPWISNEDLRYVIDFAYYGEIHHDEETDMDSLEIAFQRLGIVFEYPLLSTSPSVSTSSLEFDEIQSSTEVQEIVQKLTQHEDSCDKSTPNVSTSSVEFNEIQSTTTVQEIVKKLNQHDDSGYKSTKAAATSAAISQIMVKHMVEKFDGESIMKIRPGSKMVLKSGFKAEFRKTSKGIWRLITKFHIFRYMYCPTKDTCYWESLHDGRSRAITRIDNGTYSIKTNADEKIKKDDEKRYEELSLKALASLNEFDEADWQRLWTKHTERK